MQDNDDFLLKAYFFRHQESVQNEKGHGAPDPDLTLNGKKNASDISKFIEKIGVEKIDAIIAGNLKRHDQTLKIVLNDTKYKGTIIEDPRLNAVFSGHLLENSKEISEQKYDLRKFKTKNGELYYNKESNILFNPIEEKIYPFDPLYCAAYFNKNLRNIVFHNEKTLTSFKIIKENIISFQKEIIGQITDTQKTRNIVIISSCSPAGFNLEYALYNTIGENMSQEYGKENNPIFPLNHDQVMILGYTRDDLNQKRKNLRPIIGNTTIKKYEELLK